MIKNFLCKQVQRMRTRLAILALFVYTSICLGYHPIIVKGDPIIVNKDIGIGIGRFVYGSIAVNGNPLNFGKATDDGVWSNPNGKSLIINPCAVLRNAHGAYMDDYSVKAGGLNFRSMTNNEVIVNDGDFSYSDIAGAWTADDIDYAMNVSSNTVIITREINIKNVYGGRTTKETASKNTVIIKNVTN